MMHPILLAELNRIMGGALPNGQYGGTQVVGGAITGGGSSGSGGSGTGSAGGSGGTNGSDEADETITKNADGTVTTVSRHSDGVVQTTIEFPNGVKVQSFQFPDDRIAINVIQPDGTSSTRLLNPDGSLKSTSTTDIDGNRTLKGDGYTLTFRADGGASREIHRSDGNVLTHNSNADGSYTMETRGSDGTLLWRRSVDAEGYGEIYQARADGLNLTLQVHVREDENYQEHDEILSGSVDGKTPSSWERATGTVRGLVDWIVDEAINVWDRPAKEEDPEPGTELPKDSIVRFSVGDDVYALTATRGTAGDDQLSGSRLIAGLEGADTLIGSGADDILDGGAGNDILRGEAGDDHLRGGYDHDSLFGGADDDALDGGAGDDILEGGLGGDRLVGGAGYDFASYATAGIGVVANLSDRAQNLGQANGDAFEGIEGLIGSAFGDELAGDGRSNSLYGREGNDWLYGQAGQDFLSGAGGDDVLDGGSGADGLDGGAGYDYASYATSTSGVTVDLANVSSNTGDAAGDTFSSIEGVHGSAYDDRLGGNALDNYLFGRGGNDVVAGHGGNDHLFGEAGHDRLAGGGGADYLDGGEGFDIADYSGAASGVVVDRANAWRNTGEAQGDTYSSIEGIAGSAHADELYGDAGGGEFYAGAGHDLLEGRGGADYLDGGEGWDFALYSSATAGVRASLLNRALNAGDAAGDTFVSIEGLAGSAYGDMLQGNHGGNELYGHDGTDELRGEGGQDFLSGGAQADTLVGGDGSDWLNGGAGRDVFRFETEPVRAIGAFDVDTIQDFSAAEGDRIELATNVFQAFAPVVYGEGYALNAALKSTAFTLGTAATSAEHRIVYNQATGALYYDADGSSFQGQTQIAQLKAGTALSAANIGLYTL